MSNDQATGPVEGAGESALRLDADRARDELEQTLGEIEARLNPQRLVVTAKRMWSEQRDVIITASVGAVSALGVIIWLVARGKDSRG